MKGPQLNSQEWSNVIYDCWRHAFVLILITLLMNCKYQWNRYLIKHANSLGLLVHQKRYRPRDSNAYVDIKLCAHDALIWWPSSSTINATSVCQGYISLLHKNQSQTTTIILQILTSNQDQWTFINYNANCCKLIICHLLRLFFIMQYMVKKIAIWFFQWLFLPSSMHSII